MEKAMPIAQETIEALLLMQALRPLAAAAGPAGDYCVETFARTVLSSMENHRG